MNNPVQYGGKPLSISAGLEDCTVKKVITFPVPSRDVTNEALPCRELLNYSQPGRVWLVTFRLGTGKIITYFYSVWDLVPGKPKDFVGTSDLLLLYL